MSKDMLGPIVRALVAVPHQHHGVVLDFVNKLGGEDADNVRKRVSAALRQPRALKVEEPAIDTIIRIDRTASVPYPDWVKEVLHPAIERNAPAEYDLANLPPPWLHDGQKDGNSMPGQLIYEHLLSEKGALDSCLSLSDGLAIQQKGVDVFRQVFGNNYVFLWGSVVRDRLGRLLVPCVREGEVVVFWDWLGDYWCSVGPAARFAS